MLKALYYPHTEVSSPTIVKNALLLWDSLETIVPRAPRPRNSIRITGDMLRRHTTGDPPHCQLPRGAEDPLLREATDLVVRPRRPSNEERADAHAALEKMLESGQIATLIARAPNEWRDNKYLIYPDKFLHSTWTMLETDGLARFEAEHSDYGVPTALGFLMMSLLADSCAGTQIQKITDRMDAYCWLAQAHASVLGASQVSGLDASQVAPAYDRLVSISLEVLDARNIPLKKLVEFRKREGRDRSIDYKAMRRKYLASLDAHIKRVTKEAKSAADLRELEAQFRDELRHDLADLKAELGLTSMKALFSKEVAISTLISAGTLIAPIPGLTELSTQVGLVGIIPLLKSAVELRGARRTALLKHTSSWLYLATKSRVQVT